MRYTIHDIVATTRQRGRKEGSKETEGFCIIDMLQRLEKSNIFTVAVNRSWS
jgi:hypothetical protein